MCALRKAPYQLGVDHALYAPAEAGSQLWSPSINRQCLLGSTYEAGLNLDTAKVYRLGPSLVGPLRSLVSLLATVQILDCGVHHS